MRQGRERTLAFIAAGWLLATAAAAPTARASEPARDDIEAVVRALLEREPELVIRAIETFRAQQETAREAAQLLALQTHGDALTAADHPSIGPADAAVTVVEFFDYRCSFCRRMAPTLSTLLQSNPQIRRVYIEFPVLGPESLRASQAALAVWRQDASLYPAFHEALMGADDLSAPALVRMAEAIGVDSDRMLREMQSGEVRARLQRNYELAQAIGVEGTPAYVIGHTLLPGAVPLERLQAAIEAAERR